MRVQAQTKLDLRKSGHVNRNTAHALVRVKKPSLKLNSHVMYINETALLELLSRKAT